MGLDLRRKLSRHLLKKNVADFYRRKAPVYDQLASGFKDPSYVRLWVLDLMRLIGAVKSAAEGVILDVACGSGAVSMFLARKYHRIIGVDLTRAMLSSTKKNVLSGSAAEFDAVNADVDNLPFKEGSFDAVTCQRAFHHFPSPHSALQEMRRVLRPLGQLVIGNPAFPEDDRDAAFLDRLYRELNPAFRRFYKASEYNSLLNRTGFDNVRVSSVVRAIGIYETAFIWTDVSPGMNEMAEAVRRRMKEILNSASPETTRRLEIQEETFSLPHIIATGFRPPQG